MPLAGDEWRRKRRRRRREGQDEEAGEEGTRSGPPAQSSENMSVAPTTESEENKRRREKRRRERGGIVDEEERRKYFSTIPSDGVWINESGPPEHSDDSDIQFLDEVLCPICLEHPHNAVLLHCASTKIGCRTLICKTSSQHSNCYDKLIKSPVYDYRRCPCCRGRLYGAMGVEGVKEYLDQKVRSCSNGSCQFSGNYSELRKHAKREHRTSRPAEVDPSRMEAGDVLLQDLHPS